MGKLSYQKIYSFVLFCRSNQTQFRHSVFLQMQFSVAFAMFVQVFGKYIKVARTAVDNALNQLECTLKTMASLWAARDGLRVVLVVESVYLLAGLECICIFWYSLSKCIYAAPCVRNMPRVDSASLPIYRVSYLYTDDILWRDDGGVHFGSRLGRFIKF